MIRVAICGLGKLGGPIAVAIAQTEFGQKYQVLGYDPAVGKKDDLLTGRSKELGPTLHDDYAEYVRRANLVFCKTLKTAVTGSGGDRPDLIFVIVQTPHGLEYEGITPLPQTRADFDYSYLVAAVKEIAEFVTPQQMVVVMSTVLPGTMRREISPVLGGKCYYCYNPAFPAMGTVLNDFLNPEFVLIGSDDPEDSYPLCNFYRELYDGLPVTARLMSYESAELAKVAYNIAVEMKVTLGVHLMEVCHRTPGCHIDAVTGVLKTATKRIISPRYLDGGVPGGGSCHPRDLIAMSWLAREKGLSYDLFGSLMEARERQARWLTELVTQQCFLHDLPIILLGKAYKAESSITTGSAALLVANILRERGWNFEHFDPVVDEGGITHGPSVFLILTKHGCFRTHPFPPGSVVLDPFRYIPAQDGVTIIPVGVGR